MFFFKKVTTVSTNEFSLYQVGQNWGGTEIQKKVINQLNVSLVMSSVVMVMIMHLVP